jgi:hypothetical protein
MKREETPGIGNSQAAALSSDQATILVLAWTAVTPISDMPAN